MELDEKFVGLTLSSTLFINEEVTRLWQAGENVFHLGFGESRFAVHPKLQAALVQQAHSKSYLPALGLPSLREKVARYYSAKLSLDVSPKQVIIGPGSKALIYALQMALDADLFLPSPSWVSYAPQAHLLNKAFSYIPSRVAENYRFDLDAFDAMVQGSDKAQKLLIINSPNNPTGQMLDEVFLQELAAYCRQENVLVISDEIYFLIRHGDIDHVSIAKYYPEGSFILGGLSKHLSLGGWRLGIAIIPDDESGERLTGAVQTIASETWSSVSSPVQHAALTAYSGDSDIEAYITQCSAIHGIRTRYLYHQLRALGVTCTYPQGAFYLAANFDKWAAGLRDKGIHTSVELAKVLLARHHIATLATDAFGIPKETFSLRLACSYIDMETDADSDRLLALHGSKISDDEFMSDKHHPNMNACIAEFASFISWIEAT